MYSGLHSKRYGKVDMEQADYMKWLACVDDLTADQRNRAAKVLAGQSEADASRAAVEQGIDPDRTCPHCQAPGALSHGRARGLQRYRCKTCGRTFNAVTGTALSGLHYKERWLAFSRSLAKGEAVKASAQRCGIDPTTAFRWRHRFLKAAESTPDKLKGIVEADEPWLLESRKGARQLDRKPRRRGGKASRRGLSREQVPVLVATDRSGTTFSQKLISVTGRSLAESLGSVIDKDALLVTDGHSAYPPCAAALGIAHEALNRAAGERIRGHLHIQTVNSRHSQLKDFLRPFRGVATRYLDNYLRWFHLTTLSAKHSARACLAEAINRSSTQFAN